jgi:hypothetical protein
MMMMMMMSSLDGLQDMDLWLPWRNAPGHRTTILQRANADKNL